MGKSVTKIRVLLWKSFHSRIYYWKTTLIEALVPIIIALYVTWVISKHGDDETITHPASFKPVYDRASLLSKAEVMNTLVYTPSCNFTTTLLTNVKKELRVNLKSMENEDELEKFIMNETQPALVMGIVFHGFNSSKCDAPPDNFTYELRQSVTKDTRLLFPLKEKSGPYSNQDLYLDGGFAGFQLIVNENFIKMKNPKWTVPAAEFQPFPYPEYETSPVPRETLSFVICFSIIITLLALSVPFINHVTEEKGNGTKALMMIHGVKEWVIWFCWFMHAIMVLVISLTIMTVILKFPMSGKGTEPFRFVPFTILWLIFILYCIANMSFSFLFCAIFHQGAYASFMFMVVSVIEIVINLSLTTLRIDSFSLLFCIFPSTAFAKAFDMILLFEEIGVTQTWQSIMVRRDHTSPVSLFVAIVMLIFDIILYTFLTYYISAINPGAYGIKKSPFFLLEYCFPSLKPSPNELVKDENEWEENLNFIEPPSLEEESSMQIKDLYKEYGSFYAVNGVDMEIYESEITVLLGHNGAGKTTLLGIIAGLIAPDSGSITYNGMDVIQYQEEFRENLGVMFQDNRLFPYLSVKNHLIFYGMLKGSSRSEASEEAENYLSRLEMYDDQDSWITNISEGMKRKLSFMISLMGNSKVLILDQPTAGMDLPSKVTIWDFLMDIREGRTIISTARDMHDAEKIASRIAIMESGVLVSYGTIGFLKRTFGAAYELSITTEGNRSNNYVLNFINGYIPSATIKHRLGNEIVFKLQPSETPSFPAFFEDLENSTDRLGISNIELNYTTVEQILLEIGSLSKAASTDENINIISESQYVEIKEGFALVRLQLITLFKKKFIYVSRSYIYIFARIVLPILMALLAVRILELYDFSAGPHLDLSLATYPGAIVMMKNNSLDSKQYEFFSGYVKKEKGFIIQSTNENMQDELIEFGRLKIIRFRKNLIIALEFGEPNRVMYNQWMLHSMPIAITTYSNVLLRSATGTDKSEIFLISHPIPHVESSCYVESLVQQRHILNSMIFFGFTLFTVDILLFFFEFPSIEIARSFMHIQIISKVPLGIYWFTMFLFDFLFFATIVTLRVFLFQVFDDAYNFITDSSSFKILMGIILLFGFSGLFFVYVLSFFFSPSKETLIKLFVFNFICSVGIHFYVNNHDLIFETANKLGIIITVIEVILLLVPICSYNLIVGRYLEIWDHNTQCQLCAEPLIPQCLSQLKLWPFMVFASEENPHGLLLPVLFLIFDIFLYFILLWLISTGFFGRIYRSFLGGPREVFGDMNDDVRQEREDIQEIRENASWYNQVPLLVDGLTKHNFKSLQSLVSVEEVSFIAENGTCFGLMGASGSGKTTTLKMMSAEILPTSGDVSIEGISLAADRNAYVSLIGYCPQTNPLMDQLTGKEMLRLIASLRGISGYEAEMLIDQWISFLKLEKYQDRKCGTYSDGSKRKLCTAIALIGNPKVVLLDEPTTDLDPVSARRLHDIIKKCKEAGLVVVLSSPNMEECEILCDRLTILIRGVMHCIGTLKDLKKQYARGFSVTFKIHYDVSSLDETFALEENVMNTFSPRYCELIEEQRGLLRYHISDPSVRWSLLFKNLEEIRFNNPIIEEYIATNTTLEDIFIAFSQSDFNPGSSTMY